MINPQPMEVAQVAAMLITPAAAVVLAAAAAVVLAAVALRLHYLVMARQGPVITAEAEAAAAGLVLQVKINPVAMLRLLVVFRGHVEKIHFPCQWSFYRWT